MKAETNHFLLGLMKGQMSKGQRSARVHTQKANAYWFIHYLDDAFANQSMTEFVQFLNGTHVHNYYYFYVGNKKNGTYAVCCQSIWHVNNLSDSVSVNYWTILNWISGNKEENSSAIYITRARKGLGCKRSTLWWQKRRLTIQTEVLMFLVRNVDSESQT